MLVSGVPARVGLGSTPGSLLHMQRCTIVLCLRQFDRLACVDCQAGVVRVWQAVWTNFEVPPARPGLDQTADQNFRNAAKEEGFACGTNSLTTAA